MKKNCSTCEFNCDEICAGRGDVYPYGGAISDDTKCCIDWSASFEYYEHETTTAPRFLRDAYTDCHISYQEFSQLFDDFKAGRPVPINIFDAIKHVYGISMVDIAVLLGVTYGVVYRAKTKGFAQKRIPQFSSALCIPGKLLVSTTTSDFDALAKCKNDFFARPGINEVFESMPDWKAKLAQEISSVFVHCPIHVARTLARVDHLYWSCGLSFGDYTPSEQAFIGYVARGTKNYKPVHNLEYFLDIACSPHMRTSMLRREN